MTNRQTFRKVRLTYKEGYDELWVLKKLRTTYAAFTIISDLPSRHIVYLHVTAEQDDELRRLYREPWVSNIVLTNDAWRPLPPAQQLLRQPVQHPDDPKHPFPSIKDILQLEEKYGAALGGPVGRRRKA